MNVYAAALLVPLAACSMAASDDGKPGVAATGSGNARSFQIADFTAVDLRGHDDVDVRVGPAFSVRAEGPSDQLDTLKIVRDGDTLKIGRKPGMRWGDKPKVKVFVTMPRIGEATLSGSGNMVVDRAQGSKFEAAIAGSGNLSLGTLAVDDAELSIAGSGDLAAAGTAKRVEFNIAGSGDIDARRLTAEGAEVSIAGSGNVTAVINGRAEVNLMGSGDVDLGGGARCEISKMGSGNVRCGG